MKPNDHRDLLRRVAAISLAVVAAGSVTGWAHTARELNGLVAYQPVGWEALRLAEASPDASGEVRLARGRQCCDGAGSGFLKPRLNRAGSRAPG